MRRWWVWTLAVVLLLALPVSVLATYSVGDTVRDFSLKDLRGRPFVFSPTATR